MIDPHTGYTVRGGSSYAYNGMGHRVSQTVGGYSQSRLNLRPTGVGIKAMLSTPTADSVTSGSRYSLRPGRSLHPDRRPTYRVPY